MYLPKISFSSQEFHNFGDFFAKLNLNSIIIQLFFKQLKISNNEEGLEVNNKTSHNWQKMEKWDPEL